MRHNVDQGKKGRRRGEDSSRKEIIESMISYLKERNEEEEEKIAQGKKGWCRGEDSSKEESIKKRIR